MFWDPYKNYYTTSHMGEEVFHPDNKFPHKGRMQKRDDLPRINKNKSEQIFS